MIRRRMVGTASSYTGGRSVPNQKMRSALNDTTESQTSTGRNLPGGKNLPSKAKQGFLSTMRNKPNAGY